jgi:hypothetical protein
LVVRLHYRDIGAMLNATPGRGERASDPSWFSQLFHGAELAPEVEEQFEDALAIHSVLLVQDAFIDPAFRGHRLGPWTVADVIHRMADVVTSLVLMFPHLCELVIPTIWDSMEELYDAAYGYWQQQLSLEPMGDGFLGQATAFTSLENARAALEEAVPSTFITLDPGELVRRQRNSESDLWPLT